VQALLRSIRMKQLIAIPKVDLLSGSYKGLDLAYLLIQ
jgi:hypothetical protein